MKWCESSTATLLVWASPVTFDLSMGPPSPLCTKGATLSMALKCTGTTEGIPMNRNALGDRRMFMNALGRLSTSAIAAASAGSILLAQEKSVERGGKRDEKPEGIGPTEDLMREHGVLNR